MAVLGSARDAGIDLTAEIPAYNVHTADAGSAVDFLIGRLQ